MKILFLGLCLLLQTLVAAELRPVPEPEKLVVGKFVEGLAKAVNEGDEKKARALIYQKNHDFYHDEASVRVLFGDRWAAPVDFKIREIAYFGDKDGKSPPGLDLGEFPETPKYKIELESRGTINIYFLAADKDGLRLVFRKGPSK